MKKILRSLFTVLALTATVSVNAQTWAGYYDGNGNRKAFGLNATETYDQAIFIPGDHDLLGGKEIKAIRFYMQNMLCVEDFKLWVSTSLPASADEADIMSLDIKKKEIIAFDEGAGKPGYATDYYLTTPFTMPETGAYIGYSFRVTKLSNKQGKMPVVLGTSKGITGSFYFKSSATVPEWSDYSENGNMTVELLTNDKPALQNAVAAYDFSKLAGLDEPYEILAYLSNMGSEEVKSIDYTVTIDGVEGGENHLDLDAGYKTGSMIEIEIPMEAPTKLGEVKVKINVTKVNGQDNESKYTTANGIVTVVEELFKRMVILEEFTGEKCPNCPPVAALVNQLLHDEEYSQKVAGICHHDGYYTDQFTQPSDTEYTWFYNDGGGTYAPALMFDRWSGDGNKVDGGTNLTPVRFVNSLEAMKQLVDTRYNEAPMVNLRMDFEYNADSTQVEITVHGKRSPLWSNKDPRLTLTLTEDSIASTTQSGYAGTFWQMHVNRGVNSTWGEFVDWQDDSFVYKYTFNVKPEFNKKQLKVVAFMSKYDSTDPNNCTIDNGAIINLQKKKVVPSGITNTTKTFAKEVARYTVNGQLINAPQPGINIIKMSDGTVRKVFVK